MEKMIKGFIETTEVHTKLGVHKEQFVFCIGHSYRLHYKSIKSLENNQIVFGTVSDNQFKVVSNFKYQLK